MRLVYYLGVLASLGLILLIVELSRRDKLDRQSFFVGLSFALGIGFFSLLPESLRFLSSLFNVRYTYVFTSTLGLLTLLFLNLYTLSKVSEQKERINELSQKTALKFKELSE